MYVELVNLHAEDCIIKLLYFLFRHVVLADFVHWFGLPPLSHDCLGCLGLLVGYTARLSHPSFLSTDSTLSGQLPQNYGPG